MEIRNNIKVEIIRQGYDSVMSFCKQHKLSYQKVNRLIRNEAGNFHFQTIIEICEALDKNIGDLFYIKKEGA